MDRASQEDRGRRFLAAGDFAMFDETEPRFDVRLDRMEARLDAVSDLIDLERRASEGFAVDEEEIDSKLALCVDLAMAQESFWLAD